MKQDVRKIYDLDFSSDLYKWVTALQVWDDWRQCQKYYKNQYSLDDYVEAVHLIRQVNEDEMNKRRLASFNIKYKCYAEQIY